MSEPTELDASRRYLRSVAPLPLPGVEDVTHWSVYQWLPMFEAWATGMSLCGASMRQGPLPEGTAVTCEACEAYRPEYERWLAPGYRPEDDDLEALRQRLAAARDLHTPIRHMGQAWCAECSVRRSTGPRTQEWVAFVPHPCATVRALDGAE